MLVAAVLVGVVGEGEASVVESGKYLRGPRPCLRRALVHAPLRSQKRRGARAMVPS